MTDNEIYEGERLDKVNEGLSLIQRINGLTYGTDAYLLAAFIRASKYANAAELGSGTGIISLLCAQKEKLGKIYAIEVQSEFAELCERNARLNGLSDKVVSVCADVRDVKVSELGGELDVVFSNPPYMKTGAGKRNEHDEKYIARHEVCGTVKDFCAAASRLLRFGGIFYCVYRPDRMSELFAALCESKLEVKRMTAVYADNDSEPSMILVEAKKGAAAGMRFTSPLILYKSSEGKDVKRELTEKARSIYDSCSFEDIR